MRISPDNENLFYSGRIDVTNPKEPIFVFPCTSVQMRFTGKKLEIHVENKQAYWDNYIGYILDGKESAILIPKEGNAILPIEIEATEKKEHEILIFKRQDACHEVTFLGFEIGTGETVLPVSPKPTRRIEVYGDSVSAGEVSEAIDYVGRKDPDHNGEYSNSWYSYAWMTARKLNAQIHNIAQGGIALRDETGWFFEPQAIGMESVWDKIHYNPLFGNVTNWDFDKYTPDVVIVAIGQNDSHPIDYMKENNNGEQAIKWREDYKAFLQKIRRQYPYAYLVCCTTLLCHDVSWDNSIGQAVCEMKDKKITQYLFKRNGNGTPGHLRISEAEEMAEELASYIESLKIEGWK